MPPAPAYTIALKVAKVAKTHVSLDIPRGVKNTHNIGYVYEMRPPITSRVAVADGYGGKIWVEGKHKFVMVTERTFGPEAYTIMLPCGKNMGVVSWEPIWKHPANENDVALFKRAGYTLEAEKPAGPTHFTYMENTNANHNKFYEMSIMPPGPGPDKLSTRQWELVMKWGRIGTNGQRNTSTFSTEERAKSFLKTKQNEKIAKGYRIVRK